MKQALQSRGRREPLLEGNCWASSRIVVYWLLKGSTLYDFICWNGLLLMKNMDCRLSNGCLMGLYCQFIEGNSPPRSALRGISAKRRVTLSPAHAKPPMHAFQCSYNQKTALGGLYVSMEATTYNFVNSSLDGILHHVRRGHENLHKKKNMPPHLLTPPRLPQPFMTIFSSRLLDENIFYQRLVFSSIQLWLNFGAWKASLRWKIWQPHTIPPLPSTIFAIGAHVIWMRMPRFGTDFLVNS